MGWKKGRIIDDNGVMKSTTTITIDILFSMFVIYEVLLLISFILSTFASNLILISDNLHLINHTFYSQSIILYHKFVAKTLLSYLLHISSYKNVRPFTITKSILTFCSLWRLIKVHSPTQGPKIISGRAKNLKIQGHSAKNLCYGINWKQY